MNFTENIQLYGVDQDCPNPELQTENNMIIPEVDINLSCDEEEYIVTNFEPLDNDNNHGVNIFCDVLVYLNNLLNILKRIKFCEELFCWGEIFGECQDKFRENLKGFLHEKFIFDML